MRGGIQKKGIGKDIHVVYTQREGGREGENRTCRYTHQHAHPSQLHNSEDVYNTPLIKTSPNEQVCIMYTSVCVPQSVNIHIFQPCRAGRGKCPEPTSDSAKKHRMYCKCVVYVWELLVYVSWSSKPTYTHYVHTY